MIFWFLCSIIYLCIRCSILLANVQEKRLALKFFYSASHFTISFRFWISSNTHRHQYTHIYNTRVYIRVYIGTYIILQTTIICNVCRISKSTLWNRQNHYMDYQYIDLKISFQSFLKYSRTYKYSFLCRIYTDLHNWCKLFII